MKVVQLILRKIIEIVATRCQILRLKFTKFNFGWGSAPDPIGELTALP